MAPHGTTEIDRFDSRLEATSVAVAESRDAFEAWLRTTDADHDVVDELMVVFSELVANAVQASPEGARGIGATAWVEDGSVVLCVTNPVVAPTPVSEPDLGDPLRTGGRGLLIVRAYTDKMRTEVADGAIVIRCERRIS